MCGIIAAIIVVCDIVCNTGHMLIITWQEGSKLKVKDFSKTEVLNVDEGGFIKAIRTKDTGIFCTWEQEGKIIFKKL